MNRILIVDDEPSVLAALQRALRLRFGRRIHVETQVDALAALVRARDNEFDVVISDLRMPAMDGVSFLARFALLQPHSVRMILTGSADFETAQRAINESGAFRYLTKPWHDVELGSHIEAALAHAAMTRQQRQQAEQWQQQADAPTAQELERRRMETLEPGITHVEWGPGGEILMPDLLGVLDESRRGAAPAAPPASGPRRRHDRLRAG